MLWCCRILPFNIGSPIKSSARFCISAREHIIHWPPNNHQCKAFSPFQQRPAVDEQKFEQALRRYYGKLRWSGDLRISRLLLALPAEWNTWSWNRPLQRWWASGLQQTPKETERIKKEICKIFKKCGLKITIEANKKLSTSWILPWIWIREYTPHSMCTANQITRPASSEIYQNQ